MTNFEFYRNTNTFNSTLLKGRDTHLIKTKNLYTVITMTQQSPLRLN